MLRHASARFFRRITLGVSIGALTVAAGIALWPKDPTPASDSRFALTALLFTTILVAIAGSHLSWRRYRELARLERYGEASSAVRDTLTFLRNEATLAARGRLFMMCTSVAALGLYVISHWPQAEALRPFQTSFATLAIASCAMIPLLALRNRHHALNKHYLGRYLREQLGHLQFRASPRRHNRKKVPLVEPLGADGFKVGGFAFSFEDLSKNFLCVGIIGSGKTVCVLNGMLSGLIATFKQPGEEIAGLVLDAKSDADGNGDFFRKLKILCRQHGRLDDLYILDPNRWTDAKCTRDSIAWNPLDNDDDALEVATRIVAVLRVLGLTVGKDGSFWLDSGKTFLRHSIVLVKEAKLGESPSILDVFRLAQEGEDSTPHYHKVLKAISARYPGAVPQAILDAISFFENEWQMMAQGQRSAVVGTITQLLDEFQIDPFSEIFTKPSTISIPQIIDEGHILYVNMPISRRERMSRFVSTLIKLEYQRHILNRKGKVRKSFFLADEFQVFFTVGEGRGDSDFTERSRESGHANLLGIQGITSLLKHTANENDVANLMGHIGIKCILRITEPKSKSWASELFGQRSEVVVSINEPAAGTMWGKHRHTSYSRSARSLPRFPNDVFTHLTIPIRGKSQFAESLMHFASRETIEHHRHYWPVNPLE